MNAPLRNSPCPCGSGKRWKDCHGALGTPADSLAAEGATRRELETALAHQKAGRFAEAVALYEAVIAREPGTFDAVHMLGVVHFQRGEFQRARELLTRALAITPADAAARHNLQLVESALERRAIARGICAEMLPRFRRRCIAPQTPNGLSRWRGSTPDLIIAKPEMPARDELDQLVHRLGASPTLWAYPRTPRSAAFPQSVRTIDPQTGVTPQRPIAIFFGADISPADWYAHGPAVDVALYCDAYDPSMLVDRIPELAREGRTPLRLLFASPELARRIGLPGCVVEAVNAA
jgi:tetratricopeptide (TPR) repeat protein